MRGAQRGLLRRRPVQAAGLRYIGKESNSLEDAKAGRISDLADVLNQYSRVGTAWPESVQWVLRQITKTRIAAETGLSSRTIAAVRNGRVPHSRNRAQLLRAAGEFARDELRRARGVAPSSDFDACEVLYANIPRSKGSDISKNVLGGGGANTT